MKKLVATDHLQLITVGIAMALQCAPAMSQTSSGSMTPPAVPANLVVPPGNKLFLKGSAVGTQNFVCLASAAGFTWSFIGPQATLFISYPWINGEIRQQITTHFLSSNPMEAGAHRPTWQSSLDTSAVWGKVMASSTDSNFVAPGAIPWLLLEVVGAQKGPSGGSMLSSTTFIQRVKTSGGIMPATGCSQATEVGRMALVPYTTDYFFYKPGM